MRKRASYSKSGRVPRYQRAEPTFIRVTASSSFPNSFCLPKHKLVTYNNSETTIPHGNEHTHTATHHVEQKHVVAIGGHEGVLFP
jgi:hypothetical protein